MLHTWLLPLLPDYTVKDLIDDVRDWVEEGYVDSTIWKRLQNCVVKDILPTFSEISELRQRSMSSESLVTDSQCDSSHKLLEYHSDVASAQSPQVTREISIGNADIPVYLSTSFLVAQCLPDFEVKVNGD